MFPSKNFKHIYEGRMTPFKIVGNLYFVGSYCESSHLIDTGDGLILIDTGNIDVLHLIVNSIYELGFKPQDIKYIINTHWHWDHAEGSGSLAHLAGAKTIIGRRDAENVRRYFEPDILISDGDKLELGNTVISFMETPGHTEGTLSFFFDVTEGDKTYRVGMFGGAGANTLVPGELYYEGNREDYRASINRLRKEKVDVFIGNHVWNNDTEAKGKILLETGENRFIDDKLWGEFLDFCEKRLDKIIENEK